MEAQQQLDERLLGHLEVADVPVLVPGVDVLGEAAREVRVALHVPAGGRQRLGDRVVVAGEERDDLLDPDGLALGDVEVEHLLHVVVHLVERASGLHELPAASPAAVDPRAGGLGDVEVRLPGADLEGDDLRPERAGRDGIEVAALEVAVAGHHVVVDAAVDRRDDPDPARPVLRGERPLHRGLVAVGHGDETAAAQRRLAAPAVAEAELAPHRRGADVVGVAVVEHLDVVEADRVLAVDAQLEDQPVRQVDEVLVEDRAAAEDGRLAVVRAVGVGAGVVRRRVGVLPLRGAARAEVAVAGARQRLAQALVVGLEAAPDEGELVGDGAAGQDVGIGGRRRRPVGHRAGRLVFGRRRHGRLRTAGAGGGRGATGRGRRGSGRPRRPSPGRPSPRSPGRGRPPGR
ncbi:MAG: hypothetical protein K0S40_3604 [Actinomycetospora sp.]|nr:hypothetical protein [Actinomycetospora sp.]